MTQSNDGGDVDRRSFVGLGAAVGVSVAAAASRSTAATTDSSPNAGAPQSTMRLPNLAPDMLTPAQRPLFEKLHAGIAEHLQGFTTQRPDGALIGPFNAMLHFPTYGGPAWDIFLSLAGGSVLPKAVREVVILATGARFGSLYELYSHEALAPKSGLSAAKIRTLAAGERPADLTDEEAMAYDVAAVLNRGRQVPNSTYQAAATAFGVQGVAEIAYLVGCYGLISSLLNTFDVNLPGTELG
ncbi:MAG: carboxymuconolactone decarboxylase family protein [Caulobacteraceae bacterium]